MNKASLFQCFPCYKPHAIARQIDSLMKSFNVQILLDLEDSIQDVKHPEFNSKMKEAARKDLISLAQFLPNLDFCIRINSVFGNEFLNDIILLEKFQNRISGVFIPKVENSKDIAFFYENAPNTLKLNIIIETRKGVNNLEEILQSKYKNQIQYVFFGNYDYCYDTNTFPIHEQHSDAYWKTVEPIITTVEKYNLKFGNSPCANLNNFDVLKYAYMKLQHTCNRNFAIMSLHKTQTHWFTKLMCEESPETPNLAEYTYSHASLNFFEKFKQKGRSFAHFSNTIITPHEYLLAKRAGLE